VKTSELRALLRAWYEKGAYAVLEEVSDAAGFDRSRSADMIAMGLWPSRGLLLEGLEIKVSRADWIKELRDPAKAETFVRWCDKWWIATGDPAIIQAGELPEGWGHLSVVNGKLKLITPAVKLTPQPIERGFLAALLKRAGDIPQTVVDDLVKDKLKVAVDLKTRNQEWSNTHTKTALETLQAQVHAFEQATGMHIGYPHPEQVALYQALKQLTEFELPSGQEMVAAMDRMECTTQQTLLAIQRVKAAYAPVLARFTGAKLVQLPPGVPPTLLDLSAARRELGGAAVASGHVIAVSLHDLWREKVKCSRGFFRIWEPPLVNAARSRGTKRYPSVRRLQADEVTPAYRLELKHLEVDGSDVELVYTETADTEPCWDLIALLPEGWHPKLAEARKLDLVIPVQDRPHQAWAVPVTPDTPLAQLGSWIMSGELSSDERSSA